jgi:hypothetical protein
VRDRSAGATVEAHGLAPGHRQPDILNHLAGGHLDAEETFGLVNDLLEGVTGKGQRLMGLTRPTLSPSLRILFMTDWQILATVP